MAWGQPSKSPANDQRNRAATFGDGLPCWPILRLGRSGAVPYRCPRTGEATMAENLRARSSEEVFEDHLRLAGEHRFEEDIERNVSPDCVVLERRGVFRGHDGVRELARLLDEATRRTPTRTDWLRVGSHSWNGRPKPITLACVTGLTRSSLRTAGSSRRLSTTPSSRHDLPLHCNRRPRRPGERSPAASHHLNAALTSRPVRADTSTAIAPALASCWSCETPSISHGHFAARIITEPPVSLTVIPPVRATPNHTALARISP
jgi:hypothetical protein